VAAFFWAKVGDSDTVAAPSISAATATPTAQDSNLLVVVALKCQ
jgi:glutamine synthetase